VRANIKTAEQPKKAYKEAMNVAVRGGSIRFTVWAWLLGIAVFILTKI